MLVSQQNTEHTREATISVLSPKEKHKYKYYSVLCNSVVIRVLKKAQILLRDTQQSITFGHVVAQNIQKPSNFNNKFRYTMFLKIINMKYCGWCIIKTVSVIKPSKRNVVPITKDYFKICEKMLYP